MRNAPLGARRAGPPGPPSRGSISGKPTRASDRARPSWGRTLRTTRTTRGAWFRWCVTASSRPSWRGARRRFGTSFATAPPTARRTRLPPCACVAGTSTRSRSRGARRRARPRAWTRAGDRRGSRSVARSTPTATGTWCGGTSARPRATRRGSGRDRGMRTGVVDDRSPSRLRRGIATRTATRTSPRPSRTFTTTHRPRYSPHPSSPSPGASPRSRGGTKTLVLRPELIPDVPEFRLGAERRSRSPAGFALNAHASAQSGVDAAREALDDVARDLRDAHERSAEKMRALAQAMDARENRLAESARAHGRPAAPHRRARGGGRRRSRVGGSRGAGARRPGRARRGAAARRPRRKPRSCARRTSGQAGGGGAGGARARGGGGGGARGGGDGAGAGGASVRGRGERNERRDARFRVTRAPRVAAARSVGRDAGVATRDAVRASGVRARKTPTRSRTGAETAEPLSHARFARPERAREEPFGAHRDDPPNDGERT